MLHRDVQSPEVKRSWNVFESCLNHLCHADLLYSLDLHTDAFHPDNLAPAVKDWGERSLHYWLWKCLFVCLFVCIFKCFPDMSLYCHYNFPCSFSLWNCVDVEIVYEMIIATLLVSAQIPELTKSTVLMRERSRVEKTIRAMQHTGAGGLQVNPASILLEWLNTLNLF